MKTAFFSRIDKELQQDSARCAAAKPRTGKRSGRSAGRQSKTLRMAAKMHQSEFGSRSAQSRQSALARIDTGVPAGPIGPIRVPSDRRGPEAKREAGAIACRVIKAGAAPATVNGECLSNKATGAWHREGITAMETREPGDLP